MTTTSGLEVRLPGGIVVGRGGAPKVGLLLQQAVLEDRHSEYIVFCTFDPSHGRDRMRCRWITQERQLRITVPSELTLQSGKLRGWAQDVWDQLVYLSIPHVMVVELVNKEVRP